MSEKKEIEWSGLHHLALKASDFGTSYRFYADGLGFSEIRRWRRGDSNGALLNMGRETYLELSDGAQKLTEHRSPIIHLALRVDDCDAAVEKARSVGAEITVEPKDVEIPSEPPIQARIAFCKGPDGESIEFFQNDST